MIKKKIYKIKKKKQIHIYFEKKAKKVHEKKMEKHTNSL